MVLQDQWKTTQAYKLGSQSFKTAQLVNEAQNKIAYEQNNLNEINFAGSGKVLSIALYFIYLFIYFFGIL